MSSGLPSAFRRVVLLTLVSALGAAAFKWLRDQRGAAAPMAPEWPPFEPTIVAPSTTTTEPTTNPERVVAPDAAPAWIGPTDDGVVPGPAD